MPMNNFKLPSLQMQLIVVLLCILIIFAFFVWSWHSYRPYYYSIARETAKKMTIIQTRHLQQIEDRHFIVKYYQGDQQQAQLVLDAAEKFITPVSDKLGYNPSGKTIIVVYPNREQLNDYFGWPADESAMGVYWAGTIRVLAPREWIDAEDQEEFQQIFLSSGPMAHEIAHLAVDYQTKGNYNRWFTEGVAQYVEMQLTGFKFTDPAGSLSSQRYSMNDLAEKFDYLPNQSLAYKQSLAAVYYLVDRYGEQSILEIMDSLSRGSTIDKALQKTYDINLQTFENQLNDWLDENWQLFTA